jgi:hypothetical protein
VVHDKIFVRIGDIAYKIVTFDPLLKLQVKGALENFLISNANPDVTIETGWDDLSSTKEKGKVVFESGALWQLCTYDGKYLFSFISSPFGPVPYKIAQISKDFTKAEVLLHRLYYNISEPVNPFDYPLDELISIHFLSRGRGIEIHACGGVDCYGRGHLFVGQSGAGKTTIARLWENEPDFTVLSDDRIILRGLENKIWMYGTPWHGEAMLASPSRAPLTAVYFLEKGDRNELIFQKSSDSISRLFTCSFPPFYNRDALDFTLTFLEGVVKTVPCYELKFTPDKSVTEFILKATRI